MIYIVITSILLFYAVYMLINVIASLFYIAPTYKLSNEIKHSVLIFYPAYKAEEHVVKNIRYMKKQIKNFNAKIYVLSQDSDINIDDQLKDEAHYFDSKSFAALTGNSYHYALEYAVNRIAEYSSKQVNEFDSVLIMDPDNTMTAESVNRLIKGRLKGADVALAKRTSINEDGSISLFDGLSERINDYMLRRAKQVVGLMPELSGSGMMLEKELFTKAVLKLDKKAPGMDKQLLINMMFERKSLNIIFDEEAVVFDEKTTESASFNRQRLRWFGNQYYNAKKFGFKLITSGRLALVDYAIALWRPPRSFQLIGSIILLPIDLVLFYFNHIPAPILAISTFMLGLSMLLFLQNEGMLLHTLKRIVPMAKTSIANGFTGLKSLKSDNEGSFIHTRKK
ncbi:MAG: hypothetical protein BalsKO_14020 [Balneolaceae bacterium]